MSETIRLTSIFCDKHSIKYNIRPIISKFQSLPLSPPSKSCYESVNKSKSLDWIIHKGRHTNVSEGLITLRMQHRWSCGEGWEKQPTIYLVERIWWCTIWGKSVFVYIGKMFRVWSNRCLPVARRINLSRSSRDRAMVCWRYLQYVQFYPESTERFILWLCPLRLFCSKEPVGVRCVYMLNGTNLLYVRYAISVAMLALSEKGSRAKLTLLLRRGRLIRHLWGGLDW